jgi:hypothetical protein
LKYPEEPCQPSSCPDFPGRGFTKTIGANDTLVVFRDTLAAIKLFADRTPRGGFAQGVVETALVD